MRREIFEDEHRWFRETAESFVSREIVPRREKFRANRGLDREIWRAAGRHGLLGLGIAAEHGGSDVADFRFNAVLGEELSKAGAAYASCFAIQTDVVVPYLVDLTTPEQRRRWLPGMCTGEVVAAIAMTEPGVGSDLAALRTTARRDGDGWVIDGAKTFITNGGSADLVIVAASTDLRAKSRGITLFLVSADSPGFARGRKLEKIGQHEADTAELFFDGVRVGEDALLGEVGCGFVHMMERLPQERLSVAVANAAHASHALDLTLEYVQERQAFGQPIGTFQNSRFTLADLVTKLDVTRTYVDRCISEHIAGSLTAVDAAKAKLWSAEVQNEILDACVQLHGGYGYMTEYDVARGWADARVTKIWAGTSEIMREVIGRSLGLGDPS
jgi:alkylation response protein AidB-like acyl-CoA dehydrogenase